MWAPWMLNQTDANTPIGQTYNNLLGFDAPFTGKWGETMFNVGQGLQQNLGSPVTDPGDDFKAYWKTYAKSKGYKFDPGHDPKDFEKKYSEAEKLYAQQKLDYSNYKQKLDGIEPAMNIIGPIGALMMGNKGEQAYKNRPKDNLTPEQGFHGFNYQLGGLTNLTGYTPGTSSFNNPYNVIPSSNITMQKTPFPLMGIGNNGQSKVMLPGNNYNFPGASRVLEIPMNRLNRKFQFGGEVPQFSEIQTEKGEYILHLNGEITPVKAKKLHKHMEDDDVTDIAEVGSFIFSRDPKMGMKKKQLEDIVIGYSPVKYSEENPDTSLPKEIKFTDLINKQKFTPADYAKVLINKFPVSDREHDAFANKAKIENKMSRSPYLEIIAALSEAKKPKKSPKFQYGGYPGYPEHQYGEYPQYQYDDNVKQNAMAKLIEEVNANAEMKYFPIDVEKTKFTAPTVYREKGDSYEYTKVNDIWMTKKKNSNKWIKLNEAGIDEVEKRMAAGRYKKYTGSEYKGSPAKKKETTYGPYKLPEVAISSNPYHINPELLNRAESTGYNIPLHREPIPYEKSKKERLADFYQNQANSKLRDVTDLATFFGSMYGGGRAAGYLGNKIVGKGIPYAKNFINKFKPSGKQVGQMTDDEYSMWMNGPQEFFPGMMHGGHVPYYKSGGQVPKHIWGELIAAAPGLISSIGNIFSGNKAAAEQKRNYRQTLQELEQLKRTNTDLIDKTTNAGYATALGNYATQDPSYNYLDLTTPYQRTDSTYGDILNNISAEKSNTLGLANQGMSSFMRNASALGLSPTQAAAYAASMQGNAANNASQQSLRLNEAYRNALLNRSNALSGYDSTLAQDRQYGQNLVRSNRNKLNSGLFSGMYSSYSGKNQGLIDLENQLMASRMGARNQNANFQTNNRYMQSNAWGDLARNLQGIQIPSRQPNPQPVYYDRSGWRAPDAPFPYNMQVDPNQQFTPTLDPYTGPSDPVLTLPPR